MIKTASYLRQALRGRYGKLIVALAILLPLLSLLSGAAVAAARYGVL